MYNRYRPRGGGLPGLPPMIQRIMIACGLLWIAQQNWALPELSRYGSLVVGDVLQGMLWQPVTYMWLHDPRSIWHVAINMFLLWMFGSMLEQVWGSRRFLQFYLTCGIGAGVIIFLFNLGVGSWGVLTLGASGAIYGVLTAFSLMWPDRTIMLLFPPIPLKAIYLLPLLFGMDLIRSDSNISHIGHVGGVLVAGFLMRDHLSGALNVRSLRYRWHRYRMRNRLRAVRREEWEKRNRSDDDDEDRPTYH